MAIGTIERPEDNIIVEDMTRGNVIIFPFRGRLNANKNKLGGIKNTPIVLSNEEAEELRQALNKRASEKGQS